MVGTRQNKSKLSGACCSPFPSVLIFGDGSRACVVTISSDGLATRSRTLVKNHEKYHTMRRHVCQMKNETAAAVSRLLCFVRPLGRNDEAKFVEMPLCSMPSAYGEALVGVVHKIPLRRAFPHPPQHIEPRTRLSAVCMWTTRLPIGRSFDGSNLPKRKSPKAAAAAGGGRATTPPFLSQPAFARAVTRLAQEDICQPLTHVELGLVHPHRQPEASNRGAKILPGVR